MANTLKGRAFIREDFGTDIGTSLGLFE